jgi:hypothetical protein
MFSFDLAQRFEQKLSLIIIGFFRGTEIKSSITYFYLKGMFSIGPVLFAERNIEAHDGLFRLLYVG